MKAWALLITGAVSPFLFTSTLPTTAALVLLVLTGLAALRPNLRAWCLLPTFFLITTLSINHRLDQRLPQSDSKTLGSVSGVIGSLPESRGEMLRFVFLPDVVNASTPARIRVHWYQERSRSKREVASLPVLHAGERWKLQLELRSPRGRVNFNGVDAERWYFADGIAALAYVQAGENIRLEGPGRFDLNHWRELVKDKLEQKAGQLPAFGTLLALAIADRRDMRPADKVVLRATGTGHLLAISGLHIGLAAVLGFYLGRLQLLLVGGGIRQRLAVPLPWVSAWFAALAYAGLAGFGVSTQRALIMLSVATLVMLSRRSVQPFLGWLIAMALVLVFDPFAPLRAGFWFSFMAVAVLLMLFVPRQGGMPGWRKVLLAQVGISLLMAPLGMYWFQQASLPGLLANLVAIPLVSLLVVPLILLSLLVLWLPGPLAVWLLSLAGYAVNWLFVWLENLAALQPVVFSTTHVPGFFSTLLAMFGAIILFLPRGIPVRLAGMLLMLPMFLPMLLPRGLPATTAMQIDLLDVGQGLAVLVAAQDYLMLYDTGPGNGASGDPAWDMVDGTIVPMLKAVGRAPDIVVVSHADLDHAGGLVHLQAKYPGSQFLASLPIPKPAVQVCQTPDDWQAGGLEFSVLHPSPGLPYLGNDSSCVVSVRAPGFSLLLSGDISELIEQRLAGIGAIKHDIVTVPHHGSSTSSSNFFIHAFEPQLALISAASNNRFGFPRKDVMQRYRRAGINTLNTADCGGIRIVADTGGTCLVESARRARAAMWRWPGSANCP
ncbi:MAG: DNA internalization-related competence protein ComEC/Rec2 [Xanthomonadales bacterium]|nr:DNA internalization-related competence protein ComEC/Rec2 [Xanthomonadales bacterium]